MSHIMDGARHIARVVRGEPTTPGHATPEPDLGPYRDRTLDTLAAKAYAAYGQRCGWRTLTGQGIPRWGWLADRDRDAWRCAISAVLLGVRAGTSE